MFRKEMIKKYLPLWVFVISFLYALPTYNKFWFPLDEGITLVCTDIVMHGGIPYKDFVTLYVPVKA